MKAVQGGHPQQFSVREDFLEEATSHPVSSVRVNLAVEGDTVVRAGYSV